MSTEQSSEHLRRLIESVKADWRGTHRKLPDPAIFALQDEGVVAAIERRFASGVRIADIRQLEYSFATGLNSLVFEFDRAADDLASLATDAFLVLLNGDGAVVALVDPFDPVQPNKYVPPLPTAGEQPFVLERPSATDTVAFEDAAVGQAEARARAFMSRLGVVDGLLINTTWCDYATHTPVGWKSDRTSDDCAPIDTILT